MQGPDPYLIDLGIMLACVVHPDRDAVIDSAHRIYVNWETYYVSDDASRETFMESPFQYTGNVTDPVSRVRFTPTAKSPRRDTDERIYYFASSETAQDFDSNPTEFTTPMPGMVELEN